MARSFRRSRDTVPLSDERQIPPRNRPAAGVRKAMVAGSVDLRSVWYALACPLRVASKITSYLGVQRQRRWRIRFFHSLSSASGVIPDSWTRPRTHLQAGLRLDGDGSGVQAWSPFSSARYFNIALSSSASANGFFNWAFSDSRSLRRFALLAFIPSYWLSQRAHVDSAIANSRHTS